jgi:hypothetical protein
MSQGSNTLSQACESASEWNPTLANGFYFWELGVLKCLEILEQGFGDQTLSKLGKLKTIENLWKEGI